ncbi:hypothetical protein L1049_015889 [Liquidambar formosana]|uniref:Zinc finger CCCH domain-containing protein 5 n=1 Tax=Liquidambar formosana TaxID=63359 RepID=A0AAP0X6F7_LIQFO
MKKKKRKEKRKEVAEKEREEEEAKANDPEEQRRLRLMEEEERERVERERKEFEERERVWVEMMEKKKKAEEEEEEERRKILEESTRDEVEMENKEGDDWEYVEDGPAEIIWQGNEIIVKKKRVRVPKKDVDQQTREEDADRPTSNPLPPQSEAFADYKDPSVQQVYDNVAQQVPNFGTEQDKAHCPFHIKTGACRFGQRCSRVHFYPDKSCTLLIKNMYNGPGLAWEQDEGLEHTDEEIERCYEEFYEDVHTEFLKFGEIVNFKVCKNGSFHLRGNVYVHYKSLDSAVLAYHSMNGRYFAGKQVKCEFIGVTRWKVAICGEYMKSRLKTCSHGTACNFIHCFRNPGGDYEWADWDKPPPRYWMKKMAALFGHSDESGYEKQMEQESLGQLRNSNRRITAVDDRYRSRRSRSRETDCLNSGSGRSHYDEKDIWNTHQQMRKSNDRKSTKILDEEKCKDKTDFKGKYHSESRHRDTSSGRDWTDRDKGTDGDRHHSHTRKSSRRRNEVLEFPDDYGDIENITHEADSDGDWLDRDGDRDTGRDRRHGRTRKSSRHQSKASGFLDDHGDSRKRTRDTDSGGDWSDGDRARDRHRNSRRKSSRRQNEVLGFLDDNENSKSRTHNTDSSDDWSDRDRERHHSHPRKRSRQRSQVSGVSDSHDDAENKFRDTIHGRESDIEKSNLQRIPKRSHSSRRDGLSIDLSEADSLYEGLKSNENQESSSSDRYNVKSKSHDIDSNYNSDENIEMHDRWKSEKCIYEEQRKYRRKKTSGESDESGSPDRYDGRSHDLDSGYCSDENIDERGNWESEESVPDRQHKSRRKYTSDDHEQYHGKSNFHVQKSGERYDESRSRGRSLSSCGRPTNSLDETDSAEEYQESEEDHKKHHGRHRSHGHKQHDRHDRENGS